MKRSCSEEADSLSAMAEETIPLSEIFMKYQLLFSKYGQY